MTEFSIFFECALFQFGHLQVKAPTLPRQYFAYASIKCGLVLPYLQYFVAQHLLVVKRQVQTAVSDCPLYPLVLKLISTRIHPLLEILPQTKIVNLDSRSSAAQCRPRWRAPLSLLGFAAINYLNQLPCPR